MKNEAVKCHICNKESIIKIDIHKYDSIRYKQMEFELEDERKYN